MILTRKLAVFLLAVFLLAVFLLAVFLLAVAAWNVVTYAVFIRNATEGRPRVTIDVPYVITHELSILGQGNA